MPQSQQGSALDPRTTDDSGLRNLLNRVRYALPRGQMLPPDAWERRHRGILILLWLHVVGLPLFGITQGYGVLHCMAEGSAIAALALAASLVESRKARACLASLGLLTSSALLVHFSGGYIEDHFHFFVMIVVLTLYEDWTPFLLAVAYVVLHHGLAGALDPARSSTTPPERRSRGNGPVSTRCSWPVPDSQASWPGV